MKFWQGLMWIEPEQLLPCAQFAEEVGFDGIFLADHGVYPDVIKSVYPASPDGKAPMSPDWPYPDVFATMGVLMGATKKIKYSIAVYVLPLRSPIEVGKTAGTLAVLSDNRIALGIGVGWMKEEFDVYGVDFHTRGKRTDEMIEVMQKLWRGGMQEHHGRFFDFPRLQVAPSPSKPVPIWVGGYSDAAERRAATLCDGWLGQGNTTDQVPGVIERINRLRKEAGRDRMPFDFGFPVNEAPSVDLFKRLQDWGCTIGFSPPFYFELGLKSTLDQKKRVMERFANDIIRKM